MRILALETATRHGSVALLDGDHVHLQEFDPRGAGAVAAAAAILAEAGWKPSDLDAVAVSVGPGSFTGVRIGVSAAQGLCRGTGAVAVPVGTLEGLAWAGRRSDWGLEEGWILASVDARRAEVYAALYRVHGPEPELQWGPEAISCVALADRFARARDDLKVELGVLAGDGAALLAPLFPSESGWDAPSVLDRPWANAVARAAARKLENGESVAPQDLAPVYLRKSDAELRREQRLAAD